LIVKGENKFGIVSSHGNDQIQIMLS
jgi:hypothetical protein